MELTPTNPKQSADTEKTPTAKRQKQKGSSETVLEQDNEITPTQKKRGHKPIEHVVKRILSLRRRGNKIQYLVEWENRDLGSTWEPAEFVENCKALDEFLLHETALMVSTEYLLPKNAKDAKSSAQSKQWLSAMQDEVNALYENQTWDLVPRNEASKVLQGRWVFRVKDATTHSQARFKARYVVKGYEQQYGENFFETFAPTLQKSTLRILLALVAKYNLVCEQLDVTTAFLNGEMDCLVWVEQPPEFEKE